MALSPRLEVRQSQSLTLTPQLMQSIRLLQLSHLDLNAFVDEELLRNPLLERDEGEPAASDEAAPPPEAELPADADMVLRGDTIDSAESIANDLDTAVDNVFPEQTGPDAGGLGFAAGGGSDGEAIDYEQFVAARPTLAEHLAEQVGHLLADPAERLVARYLIDGLNETGYLTVSLADIAAELGAPLKMVDSVLARIQGCDPVGVFARDVAECLTLQLRERDRFDPLMAILVAHLDLLAGHDLAALGRAIGCDREELLEMIAELRALDPRPGLSFDAGPVEAVVPDVFVRPGRDGWAIELNADILPRVLVNRTYYAAVTRRARNPAEKSFLTDALATANWLTRSLDQRAQTMLKVATEIVRQQDGFLVHGITELKPMTLKLVADAIEMHESTVSRVTANKYLATPRGLFEMKYFFTTGLASSTGGEDFSAETVRHRIRQLVEQEAPGDILSDDTIAELLQREQGIEVARRTVAKYREGMNIPSSVIRRRQKRELAPAG
jgi:RNA polymerase sigma-54 factor